MDYTDFVPLDPSAGTGRWAALINARAHEAKIAPCLLAAIVEQESAGENVLEEGVKPGPGCGCGVTQVTSNVDWSDIANPAYLFEGKQWELLDPSANLHVAAKAFLAPALRNCKTLIALCPATTKKFGGGQLVFYIACSFNAGFGAVSRAVYRGTDPDLETTNHYGAAVLATYEAYVAASHAASPVPHS
jgi:hypothetical protein